MKKNGAFDLWYQRRIEIIVSQKEKKTNEEILITVRKKEKKQINEFNQNKTLIDFKTCSETSERDSSVQYNNRQYDGRKRTAEHPPNVCIEQMKNKLYSSQNSKELKNLN